MLETEGWGHGREAERQHGYAGLEKHGKNPITPYTVVSERSYIKH